MQNSKRIILFGCKATSLFVLENLQLPYPITNIITITPEAGEKHQVADYCDLSAAATSRGIELYQARTYSLKSADDQAYINSLKADIAFVIGWQRLIPATVLDGLRIGAFGMHGSSMNLPLGRGRSPMNWSIIEGRTLFYTNLFRYDPGVDSGDIIDTFKFQITDKDTAETMHFKNTLAMKYLIEQNIHRLLNEQFEVFPQDDSIEPTYYPKRTPADSLIFWKQDAVAIERFIRAVCPPFNGAFSFLGKNKIRILRAQIFDLNDFGYEKLEAGTIAAVFPNGKFLVKCFGGLLLVTEHDTQAKLEKGMQMHNNGLTVKQFPRNRFGCYDIEEGGIEVAAKSIKNTVSV